MNRAASFCVILLLAACARQEPVQPDSAAPAPSAPATATPLPVAPPAGPSTKAPATAEVPAQDGAALFNQNCATCHMADGGGVPFLQPSIRGSAWISSPDPQLLLSLILRGSAILGEAAQAYENDMSPQSHLGDAEIAALATYVRQRFAAEPIAEPVTPAQVARARARARPGLPP